MYARQQPGMPGMQGGMSGGMSSMPGGGGSNQFAPNGMGPGGGPVGMGSAAPQPGMIRLGGFGGKGGGGGGGKGGDMGSMPPFMDNIGMGNQPPNMMPFPTGANNQGMASHSSTASPGGPPQGMSGQFSGGSMDRAPLTPFPTGMGAPNMAPPNMPPPNMPPPGMAPPNMGPSLTPMTPMTPMPGTAAASGMAGDASGAGPAASMVPRSFGPGGNDPDAACDTLAEVGKTAQEHLDVLMPIGSIKEKDDDAIERPVPKQLAVLENGTDIFKMFDCDPYRYDAKAVKKGFHRLSVFANPDKLGREATEADKKRFMKLKQAFTVIADDQMRAMYRQYCFGIAGSGGCAAEGHEAALEKALTMGRDLRKIADERAIVLAKASETGWSETRDDQGRKMGMGSRKVATQFNLFADLSSEDDEDPQTLKKRRSMSVQQIAEESAKCADAFLDKTKPILTDPKISTSAAGNAFMMKNNPPLSQWLSENPKSVQRMLRKLRTSVKSMSWAATALLQHVDSPWRGLETRISLVEKGIVDFLEIVKSGLVFGKFGEVHEKDFQRLLDNIHKLYTDLYEKRGQQLLRKCIDSELSVVHLLPESGGRLPDKTRVTLQGLVARPDLNGKAGVITSWDFMLQRYTVHLDRPPPKEMMAVANAPSNPDMLGLDDMDEDDLGEDVAEQQEEKKADIPQKLMAKPQNVLVDLHPAKDTLELLVKNWNKWRTTARSLALGQDAEAVAAALAPPLEALAGYISEAASSVATACMCGGDGADLMEFSCRESLREARMLAAKLLGEEPTEPPPPPPMQEPARDVLVVAPMTEADQKLKDAAELAEVAIGPVIAPPGAEKKRKRSRSRRRRRRSSSSES